jgi:hypothetical protein
MAKLNRESKLREKRAEKQARKSARKLIAGSDAADAASRPHELEFGLNRHNAGAPDGAGPASIAAVSNLAGGSE